LQDGDGVPEYSSS